MRLEDIAIVIGMPRAGTTWLYENLKKHPDICVSDYKEINRYLLDIDDKKYIEYFRGCNEKIKIDISPLYYFDMQALKRIYDNKHKVILIERDYDDWIESLHAQIVKYGGNPDEMRASGLYRFPVYGNREVIFDVTRYQQRSYINKLEKMFGDRLLLLKFSELKDAPVDLLNAIEVHLGVTRFFTQDRYVSERVNAGDRKISRIYTMLLHANLLHALIPIAIKILPRSFVHWLRNKIVYGK